MEARIGVSGAQCEHVWGARLMRVTTVPSSVQLGGEVGTRENQNRNRNQNDAPGGTRDGRRAECKPGGGAEQGDDGVVRLGGRRFCGLGMRARFHGSQLTLRKR